jgi:uncharacterized protein (UPF0332 family)
MSFDWHEYLDLARELQRSKQMSCADEARLRSAVSRAYYAAYHAARNRLEREGHKSISSLPDCHRYVWKQFKLSIDQQRREIGTKGQRLKQERRNADYESDVGNWSATTIKAILESQRVFDELAKLP